MQSAKHSLMYMCMPHVELALSFALISAPLSSRATTVAVSPFMTFTTPTTQKKTHKLHVHTTPQLMRCNICTCIHAKKFSKFFAL